MENNLSFPTYLHQISVAELHALQFQLPECAVNGHDVRIHVEYVNELDAGICHITTWASFAGGCVRYFLSNEELRLTKEMLEEPDKQLESIVCKVNLSSDFNDSLNELIAFHERNLVDQDEEE